MHIVHKTTGNHYSIYLGARQRALPAQDKITLGLVAAACVAYLSDMYVKRAKNVEDGQKVVDAMHVEQEHLKTEQPGTPSVQRSEVEGIFISLAII